MRISLVFFLAAFCVLSAPAGAEEELILSAPVDLTPVVLGPQAVELGDIDKDGKLDAVVLGKASARFVVYHGNGDGTFGDEIASGSLYLQPTDMVLADFDGDGLLDIAAINNACST
mgnify:CR=1 FL=1